MKFLPPKPAKDSFTCPHCGSIAQQNWWATSWDGVTYNAASAPAILKIGTCVSCKEHTVWIKHEMVYPTVGNAPYPNAEMPESVKSIYNEAASIQTRSPRGAAALLRLAIQVLCKELGEKGKNINEDIGNLVKKGLPEVVQQSLDVVRVTGNNAVHPGQIETDNSEAVGNLFSLINIIVEYMIALPNKVSGLYTSLPKGAVDAVIRRDGK